MLLAFATHLLAVQTPVVRLDHNVALLADVEAGALALLDVALVFVRGNNCLDFRRVNGEARACGPDTVASTAEDGGLVDVSSGHEAEEGISQIRERVVRSGNDAEAQEGSAM